MKSVEDLCPEWTDDRRMTALFAPLRNKEINPESYNAKINFWISLIERWSLENNIFYVDVSSLKTAFSRDGKSPYCLEDIVEEAVRADSLASTASYLQNVSSKHQTWSTWMLGLGAGAVKKVGSSLWNSGTGSLVVVKTVQREINNLVDKLSGLENYTPCRHTSILTEEQVQTTLSLSVHHLESRHFLLQLLLADKKLTKFTVEHSTYYKLTTSSKRDDKEVTEVDKGLVRLKHTIEHLQTKVNEIETKIERERENLLHNMKAGSRRLAKISLTRVKRYEESHSKLLNQVHNLEVTLEEILNAETNKLMMEAYDSGLMTLKKLVDDSTLEKSERTMSELAELLDTNKEIQDTLIIKDDTQNEDLEEELDQLLKEKTGPETNATGDLSRSFKDPESNYEEVEKADNLPGSDLSSRPQLSSDMEVAMQNLDKLSMDGLDDLLPIIPTTNKLKEEIREVTS